ncbi:bifunctional folylpolyglutamate synthase/dihydrofolate synthase [Siculibacillus lacustris]|uniref:Dihydrofolate synthase/folylpolyglutamate synthase n=2 Tax=Siculibacillus lacustris TaxID=1549641 RepID=A0A4Q9VY45_9HYPH|nr:bifunctional folylpolyglutamate synthase/dihydrofolate synthase [Siculibacillus lacustris]
MTRVLARLGDPHLAMPPVIHVAGTNGKGSTVADLRAILEASGRRVHVFTSPHLVRFNERVRVAGRLADDATLVAAIERAEDANAGEPITFFELMTLAAFVLFAEHPADVTLLEVGLGGRLDATNVVPAPLVSVITSISIDHEKFLGSTLTAIAGEKAGIVKRGRPVVSAPQEPEVEAVLERAAARAGVPLQLGGREWTVGEERGRMVFQSEHGLLDLPRPRLVGRHQVVNAGTAIAALEAAGFVLSADEIGRGLERAVWPARMQRIAGGPLVDAAPAGAELWLDGGHNPGAGVVVAEVVADLADRAPKPLHLIAGMLETKDPIGFFRPFAGLARSVACVPVSGDQRGRDPEELAAAARAAGLPAETFAGPLAALAALRAAGGEAPRILICGSLHLAGEILALAGMPPD